MRCSLLSMGALTGSAFGQFYAIPRDGFAQAEGTAVSADGRIVAGTGQVVGGDNASFRWTADVGRVDFGLSSGFPLSNEAMGMSCDGSAVVGSYGTQGNRTAYRWSSAGGLQSLGPLSGFLSRTYALDASGDGGVVVGYGTDRAFAFSEPFLWSRDRGIRSLGRYRGAFMNQAVAVSEDGRTVVGWSSGASDYGWRWTESGGYVPLASMPGTNGTYALAANRTASIVVGHSGSHAAMWRGADILDLGLLANTYHFNPTGVDDLGSVVVGNSDRVGGGPFLATIWSQGVGIESLVDYLRRQGVALSADIHLSSCTGVSADGRTFVGSGIVVGDVSTAFAFVVTVPSPPCGLLLVAGISVRRRCR